jgi:8-oxo-dGTP pyrophosphatase MutT (NUDIX family)
VSGGDRLLTAGEPELRPSADADVARAAIAAVDAHEPAVAAAKAFILRWLDEHPDALTRACASGHVTGSALVVDAEAHRVLLLHHRKLRRWLQPGGHTDGEANLAATALREATEETGIEGLRIALPAVDLDVHRVEPPGEPQHLHLDVRYVVVAPAGAEATGNHESTALRWVPLDQLDHFELDAGLRRLVDAGLHRLARR